MVTGGSRGIGAATAKLGAREGYAVAINYRANKEAADQVVSEIKKAGGNAVAIEADVSSEEGVVRLFRKVDEALGPVTALANNAGILEKQTRVENIDEARLKRVFAANVFGSFFCAREAIRRMCPKNGGSGGAIVNVSSIAARLGAAGEYVDYAASKAAIDAFTIGLAQEVAKERIRVNAVRPGYIYTDIHASGGEPGRVDRLAPAIPLGRGGHAEEVAKAILWLLSDNSSFTTGAILEVAGGK